jgi:hypothetical protein
MNCVNCHNKIIKCKNNDCNNDCNNIVRRCGNCWYDFEKNCIDKLPYTSYYIPLHLQQQINDEYLSKQLEAIACGKCDYITKLYLKYGKNIPLVSLHFEDVKINEIFDNKIISNNKSNQTLG